MAPAALWAHLTARAGVQELDTVVLAPTDTDAVVETAVRLAADGGAYQRLATALDAARALLA